MSLQIHTAKDFRDTVVAAAGVTDPFIAPGLLLELRVERFATQRDIWLAAGAYYQLGQNDHWYVVGRLNFYLDGQHVGVMPFSDASAELTAAERIAAGGSITTRIRPDAQGSQQPALRYQSNKSTVGTPIERDNLDIPCFSMRLEIDRIEYVVEKSYCNNTAPNFFGFLNGLQVISSQ